MANEVYNDMSLQNTIQEVKKRIDAIPRDDMKNILKFQFQTGTRLAEVLGKYAINKEDMTLTNYKGNNLVLFTIKTAKKKGKPRIVALPLNDPWTQDIVKVFQKCEKGRVFVKSDRSVETHATEYFKGLTYPIEDYGLKPTTKVPNPKIPFVEEHDRQGVTHFLRHLRSTQLTVENGFTENDRAIFFGWFIKGMGKRYMYEFWLQWSSYIDKLLKC